MTRNNCFQDMKNKIVDSHCHLDFIDFKEDIQFVIENARSNNVDYMLSISVNFDKFEQIHKITKDYKNIWCSTGVHPNNVPISFQSSELEILKRKLESNLSKTKVIGVGETGLDYFRNKDNRTNQISYFETHMEVASNTDTPVIIHTRDADSDTIDFLNKFGKRNKIKGLIHCFSSDKNLAKCALDNNFYISFSGIITFKNNDNLRKIVNYIPIDKILVETDAPYLSPVPYRGKRNEPANTLFTLKKIAQIKDIEIEKAAEVTTKNFFKLFSKAQNEV